MLIISPFAAGTIGTGVFWNSLFSQSPCSREAKVCCGGRGGVVRFRGPWMTAGDVSACPWLICWRTSVTTFCPEVVTLGSRLCVYLMLFGFLTDDFEKMKKKKITIQKPLKKFKAKKSHRWKTIKNFQGKKHVIVLKNNKKGNDKKSPLMNGIHLSIILTQLFSLSFSLSDSLLQSVRYNQFSYLLQCRCTTSP